MPKEKNGTLAGGSGGLISAIEVPGGTYSDLVPVVPGITNPLARHDHLGHRSRWGRGRSSYNWSR